MSERPIFTGSVNPAHPKASLAFLVPAETTDSPSAPNSNMYVALNYQGLRFSKSYYLVGGIPLELYLGGTPPGRWSSLQKLVTEFLCKSQKRKRQEKPEKTEHAVFHKLHNVENSFALRTVDRTLGETSPSIWKVRRTCIFDHRYSTRSKLKAESK